MATPLMLTDFILDQVKGETRAGSGSAVKGSEEPKEKKEPSGPRWGRGTRTRGRREELKGSHL